MLTTKEIRIMAQDCLRWLLEEGDPLSGDDWSMVQVCRAYLAEHPDDEHEPWGPLEATYRLQSGEEIEVRTWNGPGETVVNDVIIDANLPKVVLLENPTKGQVRKLVALLGAQEI